MILKKFLKENLFTLHVFYSMQENQNENQSLKLTILKDPKNPNEIIKIFGILLPKVNIEKFLFRDKIYFFSNLFKPNKSIIQDLITNLLMLLHHILALNNNTLCDKKNAKLIIDNNIFNKHFGNILQVFINTEFLLKFIFENKSNANLKSKEYPKNYSCFKKYLKNLYEKANSEILINLNAKEILKFYECILDFVIDYFEYISSYLLENKNINKNSEKTEIDMSLFYLVCLYLCDFSKNENLINFLKSCGKYEAIRKKSSIVFISLIFYKAYLENLFEVLDYIFNNLNLFQHLKKNEPNWCSLFETLEKQWGILQKEFNLPINFKDFQYLKFQKQFNLN